MALLNGLLAGAADLLWPPSCPSCGAEADWCGPCRPDAGLRSRLVLLPDGTPVVAADAYAGATAAAVRAWKLGGRRAMTRVLAELLADAVAHLLGEPAAVVLVPVPARPCSRRRRGADLIADLAAATCTQLPGSSVAHCLRWRRRVGEQVGASAARRRANLLGAMTAAEVPAGPVLVIDDVLTSGATLGEAVRALSAAEAGPLAAAVVAVAGLRRSGERFGAVEG